jgi:hypothetical protein
MRYFEALFQGRHRAGVGDLAPVDSGLPFQPDFRRLGDFLQGLPALSEDDRASVDLPINVPDLEKVVEEASLGRSPGLEVLSYEFSKKVMPWVGPAMAEALNSMLEEGQLAPSLRQGVMRLILKVKGILMASRLRPVTLLNTDYKLLSKVFVARLMKLLPSVLQKAQLCSVRGRNIMQGAISLWSTAELIHQRRRRGFMLNLDF